MRILQLGKFYPIRGGVEKVMYKLTSGLSEHGIECDMLCCAFPDKNGGHRQKRIIPINPNARIIVVQSIANVESTILSFALITELRKLVRERNYDIVHVHHPDPMATLALFLSGYKGKIIVHWHSDIVKQKTLLNFYMPLQNWLLRRSCRIVGTSPVYVAHSDHLSKWHFKTSYLPIGIEELTVNQEDANEITRRFEGRKIVFSLGRAVHYKGFRYLIESAMYLPDGYVIVIGGDGLLLPEMKRLARELGVQDKVVFTGFIPDSELPAWFAACSVFVLSSIMKTEAYAIVQLEAMCCSKPVVSTQIDGSGVPWVNAHGESGLVVPPKDSKALADAVIGICSDNGRYSEFCIKARKRYLDLFTKDRMIEGCMDIYDFVLENKPQTYGTMLTLLQKILWNKEIDYTALSQDPGMWRMVMNSAAAQNIYSLIFDALPGGIPDDVFRVWRDHMNRIEEYNRKTESVAAIQEQGWKRHGICYAMLKGSTVADLYPNPLHRGCGDIDWYFPDRQDWDTAMEMAKRNAQSEIYFDSDGDISYIFNGISIEHHRDWTHLSSRRLRNILGKPAITNGRISTIDNLILLNAHILHHALASGSGIKQFADLAMAYKHHMPLTDQQELVNKLDSIHLLKWTALLHSVLIELTGIDPSLLPVPAKANPRDTGRLLSLVLGDGIFGMAKRFRFGGIIKRFTLLVRYCPRECCSRYFYLIMGSLRRRV